MRTSATAEVTSQPDDSLPRRAFSRLWFRQPAAKPYEVVLTGQYQARSTSLLAPEVAATVNRTSAREAVTRA